MSVRHGQFYFAATIGLAAYALSFALSLPSPTTFGANAFFVAFSGLVVAALPRMTPAYLHANARNADLPVLLIFAVTLLIVAVAVGALFVLINSKGSPQPLKLAFALLSVPLGWFTLQAMAALHYAHLYWVRDIEAEPDDAGRKPAGGLDFPGDESPNGFDFLYFAATIGMTAQTADTAITTSRMRRTVLVHAIVSFFFNAVIVAAAVNLAVAMNG